MIDDEIEAVRYADHEIVTEYVCDRVLGTYVVPVFKYVCDKCALAHFGGPCNLPCMGFAQMREAA